MNSKELRLEALKHALEFYGKYYDFASYVDGYQQCQKPSPENIVKDAEVFFAFLSLSCDQPHQGFCAALRKVSSAIVRCLSARK